MNIVDLPWDWWSPLRTLMCRRRSVTAVRSDTGIPMESAAGGYAYYVINSLEPEWPTMTSPKNGLDNMEIMAVWIQYYYVKRNNLEDREDKGGRRLEKLKQF